MLNQNNTTKIIWRREI